ncbi:biotin biosynthesis protein BioC [Mycoplana dimorpha]|uniref:Biotin biosynthesis protein BioC n=1 Tax=Mycoplana dimorpha TaxID=28320 RepID=A0A2T5B8C7_MYCDI|nr:biotin biosynthesis protein BioC [Mycoplana dimorpha]PTM95242.1 hypothetical protein C7449_104316 [Mycoplana dimorpha]
MQISDNIAGRAASDSLAHLAARAAGRSREEAVEAPRPAGFSAGSYDPAEKVSLSVEALLVLSGSREDRRLPALTEDERNNVVTPSLEAREHAAFRHFRALGDMKSYYRAYIEYFDSLQPQDQSSPRYAGSREVAVAALRSLAYAQNAAGDEAGLEAPAVLDTILASADATRRDYPQLTVPGAEAMIRPRPTISRATSMYLGTF